MQKRCEFEKLQKTDDDVRELIQMLQELEMSRKGSVQETEQPEWYSVPVSCFCPIYGKKTVRFILDLFKRFARSSHLKQVLPACKKITFLRVLQCVVSPDLICKESFPDCTGFRLAAKISRTVVPVNGKR